MRSSINYNFIKLVHSDLGTRGYAMPTFAVSSIDGLSTHISLLLLEAIWASLKYAQSVHLPVTWNNETGLLADIHNHYQFITIGYISNPPR